MQRYNIDKTYSYIKGYAMALHFDDTVRALACARAMHNEQYRKDGQPYIIHPLTMASHAVSLGLVDDEILASILLHDVVEDCGVLVSNLPVSNGVKEAVRLLTYNKPDDAAAVESMKKAYYDAISYNRTASMVKIIDRCHNVSSMAEAFTPEKLIKYIIPIFLSVPD